ncbi:fibropellin-1-like [Watersipora subatra]|uniref:fibropellin-1-like n=1 Tax=Watersipora subatra TaxID=2589382 RepID=UPI00355B2DAD
MCDPNPCLHSSTCVDDLGPFVCLCSAGYEGLTCGTDIDDCEAIVCKKGGSCLDLVNDFECQCPSGYGGKLCDKDVWACGSSTCNGNGKGYRESHCEIEPYPCYSNPCFRGSCVAGSVFNFPCFCDKGYTGTLCDMNQNDCASNPCFNSGQRFNMDGKFKCKCHLGYEGETCAIDIDDCQHLRCKNGATCKDIVNGFKCVCPEEFVGKLCNIKAIVCKQGGSCLDLGNDHLATVESFVIEMFGPVTAAPAMEMGTLCDMNQNDCASNPCLNSGQCFSMDGQFKCKCQPGYEGDTCAIDTDDCQHLRCKNGATCIDIVNGFKCVCPEEFVEKLCNIKAFSLAVVNVSTVESPSALEHLERLNSEYCGTWLALNQSLKLQIIGYAALPTVIILLFLLLVSLLRMKPLDKLQETSVVSSYPHPVSRYFDPYDVRKSFILLITSSGLLL